MNHSSPEHSTILDLPIAVHSPISIPFLFFLSDGQWAGSATVQDGEKSWGSSLPCGCPWLLRACPCLFTSVALFPHHALFVCVLVLVLFPCSCFYPVLSLPVPLLTSLAHFSHLFAYVMHSLSVPLILRLVFPHIFAWPLSFDHVLAFFCPRPCFCPRYDLCLCLCLYFCLCPVHFKS